MIDLTYLNDITDGDNDNKRQLIEMFFNQAAEIKQRFIMAQLSDNNTEIGEIAHLAKSSTLVFGIKNVSKAMETLQHLAEKNEQPERYPEYISVFYNEIPIAIEELKQAIKENFAN